MRVVRSLLALGVLCCSALAAVSDATVSGSPDEPPQYRVIATSLFAPQIRFGARARALGSVDQLRSSAPFYTLELATEAGGVSARVALVLVSEYHRQDSVNIPWGPPGNRIAAENNNLPLGVLDLPTAFGRVSLGRQPISLGPSNLSNLHIAQHIPFLDSVVATVPLGRWSLTHAIATLENRRGTGDLTVDFTRDGYGFGTNVILLSARRFAWSHSRGEVGIGAQSLFSREFNAFQVGDFLPIFSVHNAEVGNNNLFISFDASYDLAATHRVYAIIGLDDIDGNPIGIADSASVPTVWALVAGASGTAILGGATVTYDAEVVATHYLWGSFDDDYALSRSIYRLRADAGHLVVPLTSPFGPGRVSFEARTAVDLSPVLRLSLDVLALAGDPSINLIDIPYHSREVTYQPLLLRTDVAAIYEPVVGLKLWISPGLDLTFDSTLPRLTVGAAWNAAVGIGREP